jgi:hypothetical protein
MTTEVEARGREAVLVEDAALIRMMGLPVLEALPARGVPYELSDPFILVHESRFRLSELSGMDTKHPHRGFDNLWYILEGSASTGHSTGPGGTIERARLPKGALLALRTGRGAWHAEAIGAEERGEGLGDTEWRSVLFWVNLARKDKQAEPSRALRCCCRSRSPCGRRGRDGPGAGRRGLSRSSGHAGADPRRRTARRRAGHDLGAFRVPGLRLRTRGRGRLWGQPATRQARATGLTRSGRGVRGHRRRPRHPVPAHDGAAIRRGSRVQRAVRGLGILMRRIDATAAPTTHTLVLVTQ